MGKAKSSYILGKEKIEIIHKVRSNMDIHLNFSFAQKIKSIPTKLKRNWYRIAFLMHQLIHYIDVQFSANFLLIAMKLNERSEIEREKVTRTIRELQRVIVLTSTLTTLLGVMLTSTPY